MSIDDILNEVLKAEGGYVNHPNDRGGPTNYGITQAVARANGYTGDMKDLPKATALSIYRKQYVDKPGFGQFAAGMPDLAAKLVDTGVNMGPSVAGRFLQRALNYFTGDGLTVDGIVGARTVASARGFKDKRGSGAERNLVKAVNAQRALRYMEIVEKDASQRTFSYGWFDKRVD